MYKKSWSYKYLSYCVICIVFISCGRKHKIDTIPVQKVYKGTYSDIIKVSGEIESYRPNNITCPRLRDLTISFLIPEGTYVKRGDTVCILESDELENEYIESVTQLENSVSEYNKSKSNLELEYIMLQAQVETLETSTKIKKLDSVQIKFATPMQKKIIELELQQAQIEKEQILNKLEFLKRINEAELIKMKLRINQEKNNLQQAQRMLNMLTLTTRGDGLAIRAKSRRSGEKLVEGDAVWRGSPIVIIPDLTKLQVKLQVSESDFKRLETNQLADIYIDALSETKLTGKVKRKEPVGKPMNQESKVKVFGVTVSIDSLMGNIKPGLSADCHVIINEIADTLIIPYLSVFDSDSSKYVYVKHRNFFEKRNIDLAINNNNFGVIKYGINENEEIALIKPPDSLIKTPKKNEKKNFLHTANSAISSLQ